MNDLPLEVSVDDVSYLLGRPGQQPRIIDCREQDEWQICRLPNAELVPLSQFGELAPQRFADVNQHIIIYCHHGMRSADATNFLLQQGFPNVKNLVGGIDAWSIQVDGAVPRY